MRDAYSECPYPASTLVNSGVIYAPTSPPTPGTCTTIPAPPACNAIVSTADLGSCTQGGTYPCLAQNWLDQTSKYWHATNADITPEACYANGDPALGAPLGNKVAWTRVQEWEGSPGPDDGYIGGAISPSDLVSLQPTANGGSATAVEFHRSMKHRLARRIAWALPETRS